MAEGTTTRKWEVELRWEQQPRTTQDDSMEGIGRAESGTEAENNAGAVVETCVNDSQKIIENQ